MAVVGAQDFWVTGSRFYFQRDAIDSVEQPWVDLGTIKPANLQQAIDKIELEDSDGGIRRIVDEAVTKINESYDIECNNLSPRNRALLMLSTDPEDFAQSAAESDVQHYAHVGSLLSIKAADNTQLFKLAAVAGVYSGSLADLVLTDIVKATKTLTVSTDPAAVSPGDPVIVKSTGLTTVANSRTYTVASISGSGPSWDIVVEEAPAADESSVTGEVSHGAGVLLQAAPGETSDFAGSEDWKLVSLDRGFIKFNEASSNFTAAGNLQVIYTTAAVTGKRLLKPQSAQGEIKGKAQLFYGRGNNKQQTVREANVSITPSATNLSDENYSSMTLTVRVISDLTQSTPAGRMIDIHGALPTLS